MQKEFKVTPSAGIAWTSIINSGFAGFVSDILAPSLPALKNYFQTNVFSVQLSITLFCLICGLFQLPWGSISDCLGRRKIHLCCHALTNLFIILIIFSKSIGTFLVMRSLQAFFLTGVMVMSKASLVDNFSGKELKKYLSYLLLSWGLGALIAPFIGGYLQYSFGWKGSFYFLATFSIICFFLVLVFSKQRGFTKRPYKYTIAISALKTVISSLNFIIYLVLYGVSFSGIAIFQIYGPFYIQKTLQSNSKVYGVIALILGTSYLIGTYLYRLTVFKNLNDKIILKIGVISFCIGLILIGLILLKWDLIGVVIVFLSLFFICMGFICCYCFCCALVLFPNSGGLSSSLVGVFVYSIAGFFLVMTYFLGKPSLINLSYIYLLFCSLIISIYLIFLRKKEIEAKEK